MTDTAKSPIVDKALRAPLRVAVREDLRVSATILQYHLSNNILLIWLNSPACRR